MNSNTVAKVNDAVAGNSSSNDKLLVGWIVTIILYCGFSAAVFFLHGFEPPINIDHIAYFKLIDKIILDHPLGDYWKEISAVKTYSVLLAYLYNITGNHIVSLKLMLALMTVLYLFCFDLFISLFVSGRAFRILFTLLGALHVSFGTVFWGVTDFQASLSRTLIIPPMLIFLWFFGKHENQNRKYLVFPALIYLSLFHLGSYYLLGILVLYEGLKIIPRLRNGFDRQMVGFAVSLVLVGAAYFHVQQFGLSSTVLNMLVPRVEKPQISEPLAAKKPAQTGAQQTPKPAVIKPLVLSSREAWKIERFAQPWRNFPPPLATMVGAASSLGFIAILGFLGLVLNWRRGLKEWDKRMLLFAFCTLACAYGLQFTLWILRPWVPIYPLNFEEVRAVKFLFIPIFYFVIQLFQTFFRGESGGSRAGIAACAVILVYVFQPIYLFQLLPFKFRQEIFQFTVTAGILDKRESQRSIYAKQVMNLYNDIDRRFFYSVRGVISWLKEHTDERHRILTNRDELYLLDAKIIGTSNGFLNMDLRSPERQQWKDSVEKLYQALTDKDIMEVEKIAVESRADYAVVPWKVPYAVYSDNSFSVIAINQQNMSK